MENIVDNIRELKLILRNLTEQVAKLENQVNELLIISPENSHITCLKNFEKCPDREMCVHESLP